jgi:selenocysteine-specific elongation factor
VRAVIFGTAGHIDHGKTTLVKALTGVDCDRLPVEKRRGITLVLGFAPLSDPDGRLEISFIDVPGHERLVHTMIAGAGGIDRALLVVAADEGVMPQTREHLEILDVLGVRGGVVALTKADLVNSEVLAGAHEELRQVLARGPLAGALIVACSGATGLGVDAVREAVLASARSVTRVEQPHRPFRLAVDRVFTLPGVGTVVTGTAHWGWVEEGDELRTLPGGVAVRVRSVQVHGQRRGGAGAGERVAMSLAGVGVDQVPRGEQLLSPGSWRPTRRLALAVRLVEGAGLAEGDRVWLHVLAGRVRARVEREHSGPTGAREGVRVVVRLARPVFAVAGDRVVLRRSSPASTLGGGEVLDIEPPRLRRRDAAQLAALPDPWRDLPATLLAWIGRAGPRGVTLESLSAGLGVYPPALEAPLGRLVADGSVVVARQRAPLLVPGSALGWVESRAREVLASAGSVGIPLAEFAARVVPDGAGALRDFYLGELRRRGVLRETAGRAFPAGSPPLEEELATRVAEFYRKAGFAAPSPPEAASALAADPRVVQGVVRFLIDQKRLARVGGKWIVHQEVLDEIIRSLQTWGVENFDVGAFKERFGLTRKLAIPILEWLDSRRVTRRQGDRRQLVRQRPGTSRSA